MSGAIDERWVWDQLAFTFVSNEQARPQSEVCSNMLCLEYITDESYFWGAVCVKLDKIKFPIGRQTWKRVKNNKSFFTQYYQNLWCRKIILQIFQWMQGLQWNNCEIALLFHTLFSQVYFSLTCIAQSENILPQIKFTDGPSFTTRSISDSY